MTGRGGREEVRASEQRSGNDEPAAGAPSQSCHRDDSGRASQWPLKSSFHTLAVEKVRLAADCRSVQYDPKPGKQGNIFACGVCAY